MVNAMGVKGTESEYVEPVSTQPITAVVMPLRED